VSVPSADVIGIVLAGGASSRFGSDKLAASLDGRPLLHHALEAVAQVAGSILVVVAPEALSPSIPVALTGRVAFARDAAAHGGPLAGLSAGLAAIDTSVRDEAPPIALVVGGDMPSLVPDVLRLLVQALAADPSPDVMTLAASRPAPLPMAVRPGAGRTAVGAILVSGGRRSLMALVAALPSATVPAGAWRALDPAGASLRDIDTPTDLEA
jgi:molybdopterin-guanine dinucleotide biosynthesis protein A